MNILYICNKDPRLIDGGSEQRTNLLWKALKTIGNVYTIVYTNDDLCCCPSTQENIYFQYNELEKYHSIKGLAYRVSEAFLGFSCLPYRYPISKMPEDIIKNVNFDIVVSRYIHSVSRYHLWNVAPTFVDIDDHPLQVFETLISKRVPFLLKPLCRWSAKLQFCRFLKKIQGGWIANPDQVITEKDITYLPNIPKVPSSSYNHNEKKRRYLFTIGVMSYAPNAEGVDRFLTECWAQFHSKYPNVNYIIGGKGLDKELKDKWSRIEGVEYVGFIEHLEDFYQNAIATVIPIYSGGGTCIKTLESMSYSRVCLSTPFGVRGLQQDDVVQKNGLCVFKTADEFMKVFQDLQEEYHREQIELSACRYISKKYSFENFADLVVSKLSNL